MVFSIIGPDFIHGAHFLDLYCGSGIVGLEAISRGAASATFVDQDSKNIAQIYSLSKRWDISGKVDGAASDVPKWIRSWRQDSSAAQFDIVYADPPYFTGKPEKVQETLYNLLAALLTGQDLFAPGSVMFLELSRESVKGAPDKAKSAYKRNKISAISDGVMDAYHYQFDRPWPEVYRSLGIPLEIPLLDWRLTGTTALLILGAKTCEPVREIY